MLFLVLRPWGVKVPPLVGNGLLLVLLRFYGIRLVVVACVAVAS